MSLFINASSCSSVLLKCAWIVVLSMSSIVLSVLVVSSCSGAVSL